MAKGQGHTHPTPTWTVIDPRDAKSQTLNQPVDASLAGTIDDIGRAHENVKTDGGRGVGRGTGEIATGTAETRTRMRAGHGRGKGVGVETDRMSVEVSNFYYLTVYPRDYGTECASNRTSTEDGQASRPVTLAYEKQRTSQNSYAATAITSSTDGSQRTTTAWARR